MKTRPALRSAFGPMPDLLKPQPSKRKYPKFRLTMLLPSVYFLCPFCAGVEYLSSWAEDVTHVHSSRDGNLAWRLRPLRDAEEARVAQLGAARRKGWREKHKGVKRGTA